MLNKKQIMEKEQLIKKICLNNDPEMLYITSDYFFEIINNKIYYIKLSDGARQKVLDIKCYKNIEELKEHFLIVANTLPFTYLPQISLIFFDDIIKYIPDFLEWVFDSFIKKDVENILKK